MARQNRGRIMDPESDLSQLDKFEKNLADNRQKHSVKIRKKKISLSINED